MRAHPQAKRSVWRRRAKSVLGRLVFTTGLYRIWFRDKAVIALFHRIGDDVAGNPISCTAREFRAFCDFFRRYFIVVSLHELLDRLRRGESIGRYLVITFDDGYLDNALLAAPELKQRAMSACFFITTGFIGTDRQAAWDVEEGVESRWMTWDDVRGLRGAGFEIGAHTVDHVDLGAIADAEAERQITQSRVRLQQELGEPTELFSYPFGGPDNITPTNRAKVRDAGFECCVSAYGGTVGPRSDPFAMRRAPISPWHLSPYQFGFEIMLLSADERPAG